MKHVGAHVSAAGGLANAPRNAADIGADAFALFTRNQRRWKVRPIEPDEAEEFRSTCAALGFSPERILPHDSYLINLGSGEPEILERSRRAFTEEMRRCMALGLTMVNFHPGSHKNRISREECLDRVAQSIDRALAESEGVTAVLETTAGQGTSVGCRFEDLALIIERAVQRDRIGVCLDTCHIYAAGYDIATPDGYEKTMDAFGRIIGFDRLRGIHVNDSKAALGSRVDRHHSLGAGHLGWETFRRIMADSRLEGIPLILETIDQTLWPEEIRRLRAMVPGGA